MTSPHTVIDIPTNLPSVTFRPTEGTITAITATRPHETTSSSWVPSWFPGSPLRPTTAQPVEREKPPAKQLQVGFDVPEGAGPPQRNTARSASTSETDKVAATTPVALPLKERLSRHESIGGGGREAGTTKTGLHKLEEGKSRKTKAAPPIPRTGTIQNNFSYDTLKERADIWKKEKRQRPAACGSLSGRIVLWRKSLTTRGNIEISRRTPADPKIRFTQEESDKHFAVQQTTSSSEKTNGLLFAHRELEWDGYFDTDREDFGYDLVSDQLGTMYNVIDAISRDVYERRELLYYERKTKHHPRTGFIRPADLVRNRRPLFTSPSPLSFQLVRPILPFLRLTASMVPPPPLWPHSRSSRVFLVASSPKLQAPSPTRPILKHSLSTESFKSAKSDGHLPRKRPLKSVASMYSN
ncbi:hypothetical protein BV898_18805 [Hypsibius exemplaris]|uniref:Uncharacterized protein n=1 Tax=Hypsibius exemplaris TaxID=2072580 RepID=A0A9X6NPQ5_HYPEX|nr:hypothetical protein BV898_18805 [Hypsibius exemplaris]